MPIPPHLNWDNPPLHVFRRFYPCVRVRETHSLDGVLDKPFWSSIPWTEDFVDIEGESRPSPAHRTRAKMAWDDMNLYVGAELTEPNIWGSLTDHDSIVYFDNDFEVFLNPTSDNHSYYEIEINALATVFDLFLPKPYRDLGPGEGAVHSWNAQGLGKAVHIRGTLNDPSDLDDSWSVELAVPWSAFDRHSLSRMSPPRHGDTWRMNLSRVQWDVDIVNGRIAKRPGRPEHNWVWSPQGVIDMHRPEQWGVIQFVDGSAPVLGREPLKDSILERLMAVYYAQRQFRTRTGTWAASLSSLMVPPWPGERFASSERTWVYGVPQSRNGSSEWRLIQHDSRMWYSNCWSDS